MREVPANLKWAVEIAAQNPGGGRLTAAWDAVFAVCPSFQNLKALPEHRRIIEYFAVQPGDGLLTAAWTVLEGAA